MNWKEFIGREQALKIFGSTRRRAVPRGLRGGRKRFGPGTAKRYGRATRPAAFLLTAAEWAAKYPGRKDRPRKAG